MLLNLLQFSFFKSCAKEKSEQLNSDDYFILLQSIRYSCITKGKQLNSREVKGNRVSAIQLSNKRIVNSIGRE